MSRELLTGDGSRDRNDGAHAATAPGRRTLTMSMPHGAPPIQQRAGAAPPPAMLPLQLQELMDLAVRPDLHGAAATAIGGSTGTLPHLDAIQASFGRHDVGHIRAHDDDVARTATRSMGAEAFAMGDHVAFAGAPSLHTAAHEAAHVIQQRGGVQLAGGVGEVGDVYERHADEVADAVVAGRSAEALLTPFAGGGGGATQPAIQRETVGVKTGPNVTTHVRYRAAKGTELAHGHEFIVYLPSGFDPSLRPEIARLLKVELGQLAFVNEQHDNVDLTIAQEDVGNVTIKVKLAHSYKITRAKQLVTTYLHGQGLHTVSELDIDKLFAAQPVEIYDQSHWKRFLHGIPGGSPEGTEGLTKEGKLGEREVGINLDNHTLNTIVHELFHAVESVKLHALPNGLVEAMTEYFALEATGLTFRRPIDTTTPVYFDNLRVLRLALGKGVVSHGTLVRAYFLGDLSALERLVGGWKLYARLNEQTSFAYTGELPSKAQITEMWETIEKFFS